MLMMRLQRVGRKNDPSYRIVVTDKRTGPKSGKHIDLLGSYNPKLSQFQIDAEKAKDWISKGVQPSDTLHNMLVDKKIIEGKKINVLPKKSPIKSEEPETEAAPSAEPAATPEAPAEAAPAVEAPAEETKEEVKTEEVTEAEEPKADEVGTADASVEASETK